MAKQGRKGKKKAGFRWGESQKIKWLSQPEMARLLNAVMNNIPVIPTTCKNTMLDHYKHARNVAIFELAYRVGLRASEVGNLLCEDYKRGHHELYIRSLKESKSQTLYLSTAIRRLLNKWMDVRGKHHPLDPLFPSKNGGRGLSRFGLNYLMKTYCKSAGIPKHLAHFHVIRHTFAIHHAEGGIDVKDLQHLMRHRDMKSTLVYFRYTTAQYDTLSRKIENMKSLVDVRRK